MLLTDAVKQRILGLCKEQNITINKLSTLAGLTQSTVDSIINGKSKNPSLKTLIRISEGLNLTVSDFFNHPSFRDIDDD